MSASWNPLNNLYIFQPPTLSMHSAPQRCIRLLPLSLQKPLIMSKMCIIPEMAISPHRLGEYTHSSQLFALIKGRQYGSYLTQLGGVMLANSLPELVRIRLALRDQQHCVSRLAVLSSCK